MGFGTVRAASARALASAGGTDQLALRMGPQTAKLVGSLYLAMKPGAIPRFTFARCLSVAKRLFTAFSRAFRLAWLPKHYTSFPGDRNRLRGLSGDRGDQEDCIEAELLKRGCVGGGVLVEERDGSPVLEKDVLPRVRPEQLIELCVERGLLILQGQAGRHARPLLEVGSRRL